MSVLIAVYTVFSLSVYAGSGNSLVGSFVTIPAGTFQMGSPSAERGRDSNERRHPVTISRDFEMSQVEVTQAQWFLVMGYNPSIFKERSHCRRDYVETNGISLCPNNPVEMVNWEDVQNFIRELNHKNDGYHYRLPTEAEWEYAARGGSQRAYSFGNDIRRLNKHAWYQENSGSQTQVIGQKRPNAYGLYDMHGNVWEWVEDWFGNYSSSHERDPQGPSSGSYRIVRGGAWNNDAMAARSAYRLSCGAGYRGTGVGFRLVRTIR